MSADETVVRKIVIQNRASAVLGWIVAWTWTIVAGGGGLGLLPTRPMRLTNVSVHHLPPSMRENVVVQINREDLSRHYASLSDGELLAIDPNELTELAAECYGNEVDRRRLSEQPEPDGAAPEIHAHDEIEPDWFDTAATACTFQIGTGRRYAEDAERACTILRDAGIPSQVVNDHDEGGQPDSLSVMVPGALSLKASSVLDRDLFNEQLEEAWTSHFDQLSDKELRALQPDDICAGLLDRAARLKRVYEEALAQRKP